MKEQAKRCNLTIDAHCIDDEFEESILKDYGVTIADRTGEPWSVIFEGERELLSKMVQDHWGDSIELDSLKFSPVAGSQ